LQVGQGRLDSQSSRYIHNWCNTNNDFIPSKHHVYPLPVAEPTEEPILTTDFALYAEDYTFPIQVPTQITLSPTDFANYAQQHAEVALPLDDLCLMPGAG
jgi:hypothetical protein